MKIRRAKMTDIDGILQLLKQVLEVHAAIRPDIFISGTTKYTAKELESMVEDDRKPVYVAVDDNESVIGYAFCQIQEPPFTNTMHPLRYCYIDDLCVDEGARGQHVGKELFDHVRKEASELGCYELTLCVWQGNDGAERFYEKMGMKTKERVMEFIL